MRQIKQKDAWGCGVACVAMVAGVDYLAAKAVVHGKRGVDGTWTRDLIVALEHFDITVGNRLIPFGNRNFRDLKIDAIMKVGLKKSGAWHWVVWDLANGSIRDPHDGPSEWRNSNRRPRPISYLPVNSVDRPHFA